MSSIEKSFIRVYLSQHFVDMPRSKISMDGKNAPKNGISKAFYTLGSKEKTKRIT